MSEDVIFGESKDTNVADTSKQVYKEISESGQKTSQKEKVRQGIEAMKEASVTINELSMETLAGMEKSSISGRINDLRSDGTVEFAGKRQDKYSDRTSKTWMVVE